MPLVSQLLSTLALTRAAAQCGGHASRCCTTPRAHRVQWCLVSCVLFPSGSDPRKPTSRSAVACAKPHAMGSPFYDFAQAPGPMYSNPGEFGQRQYVAGRCDLARVVRLRSQPMVLLSGSATLRVFIRGVPSSTGCIVGLGVLTAACTLARPHETTPPSCTA